jgi:nucleoside-diphosphate-sugar epimerase
MRQIAKGMKKLKFSFHVLLSSPFVRAKRTAEIVAEVSGAKIVYKPHSDNRSYSVSGHKARRVLGFEPKETITEAIEYLVAFFQGGYLSWKDLSDDKYKNIVAL